INTVVCADGDHPRTRFGLAECLRASSGPELADDTGGRQWADVGIRAAGGARPARASRGARPARVSRGAGRPELNWGSAPVTEPGLVRPAEPGRARGRAPRREHPAGLAAPDPR